MRTVIICLLLSMVIPANAQYGNSLQTGYFIGKQITHQSMAIHPDTWHHGVFLEYSKSTFGNHYWQYAHNYPQMGVQLTFRSLGDNSIYGHAISILPFLEFNIWRHRHGILQIKHGTGIAWNTKKYNAIFNPQAAAISTHINATSTLDIGHLWTMNKQVNIKTGFILHHLSNGGFKQPNYGFNTFAGYIAIRYFNNPLNETKKVHPVYDINKKWNFRIGAAIGFYDYNPKRKHIEILPQMTAIAYRRHNSRFRTGIGTEIARTINGNIQPSIYAEEEISFGKLSTRYGFARYLMNIPRPGDEYYSKIGIAYYFQPQKSYAQGLYMGTIMKAHNFRAAHIELNFGYSF